MRTVGKFILWAVLTVVLSAMMASAFKDVMRYATDSPARLKSK